MWASHPFVPCGSGGGDEAQKARVALRVLHLRVGASVLAPPAYMGARIEILSCADAVRGGRQNAAFIYIGWGVPFSVVSRRRILFVFRPYS